MASCTSTGRSPRPARDSTTTDAVNMCFARGGVTRSAVGQPGLAAAVGQHQRRDRPRRRGCSHQGAVAPALGARKISASPQRAPRRRSERRSRARVRSRRLGATGVQGMRRSDAFLTLAARRYRRPRRQSTRRFGQAHVAVGRPLPPVPTTSGASNSSYSTDRRPCGQS